MKSTIEKYNKIKPKINISDKSISIKTFVPQVIDSDYQRGFIERYFIRKVNDLNSFIFEINSNNVNQYNRNPLYEITSIDWRVTGTEKEIEASNSKSIQLGMKNISNLNLYLPNLLQFSKIKD